MSWKKGLHNEKKDRNCFVLLTLPAGLIESMNGDILNVSFMVRSDERQIISNGLMMQTSRNCHAERFCAFFPVPSNARELVVEIHRRFDGICLEIIEITSNITDS